MSIFGIGQKEIDVDDDLSPNYLAKLDAFGIRPDDVIEPISVDPEKFIVLIIKKNMWATYSLANGFQIPDGSQKILSRATFIQSIPVSFPGAQDRTGTLRRIGEC